VWRAVVVEEESICESCPFELALAELIIGCLLEGINGRSGKDDETLKRISDGASCSLTYFSFEFDPQPEAMNRFTDDDCPAALMRWIWEADEVSSATEIVQITVCTARWVRASAIAATLV
jgi:hypothetical protein